MDAQINPIFERSSSYSNFNVDDVDRQIEYYFASDARSAVGHVARVNNKSSPISVNLFSSFPLSAVIEYTNRVIFLEDDDVAAVRSDGCMLVLLLMACLFFTVSPLHSLALSIHHVRSSSKIPEETDRQVHTLKMKLQEIMKGNFNDTDFIFSLIIMLLGPCLIFASVSLSVSLCFSVFLSLSLFFFLCLSPCVSLFLFLSLCLSHSHIGTKATLITSCRRRYSSSQRVLSTPWEEESSLMKNATALVEWLSFRSLCVAL